MLLPNAVEEVATNSSFRGETSSFDHILPEKKPKDDSQELEKQEKQQRQERRQRKRQEMKDMKQRRLAHFLKTYGFSTDVNEPRVEAACSPDSLQRNTFKEVLFRPAFVYFVAELQTIFSSHNLYYITMYNFFLREPC
ncbi:unnamed protein product [Durusdinium trenchii]|uniref:Uncharacterized protein n=1 Tax=Durusdinium trenchii TaxID=1381693 RepID=A0ABP0NQ91_9DINO